MLNQISDFKTHELEKDENHTNRDGTRKSFQEKSLGLFKSEEGQMLKGELNTAKIWACVLPHP
jgi:hypothetical protein